MGFISKLRWERVKQTPNLITYRVFVVSVLFDWRVSHQLYHKIWQTVVLRPLQEIKEIIALFVQINPKEHFYINIHMILDCRMLQNIYLTYWVLMVFTWNTAWTSRVSNTMPETINGWSINWSTPDRNTLALHLYVNICTLRSIPTLQTPCSLKKIAWKCSLSAAWGQALRKGQRQTTSRLVSVGSTSVCSHFAHVPPERPERGGIWRKRSGTHSLIQVTTMSVFLLPRSRSPPFILFQRNPQSGITYTPNQ